MVDVRNLNTWYEKAFEYIQDIVWEVDLNYIFTFVSPNSKMMTGYDNSEVIGKSMLDFLTPESRQHILNQQQEIGRKRAEGNQNIALYEIEFVCKDGKVVWYEVSVKPIFQDGIFCGYIGTSRDISERKKHELEIQRYIQELEYTNKKLDELTTFDLLTGAYSRRKFEELIALPVRKKEKEGTPFSVIMFDIDRFKQINDVHGHKIGDRILREISVAVGSVLRDTDKLFRWGGDEFFILLQNSTLTEACQIAERIKKTVENHEFGYEEKKITISLGVSEYPTEDNMDLFLSGVDKAMLKAKADGRNRIRAVTAHSEFSTKEIVDTSNF